MLLIGRCTVNDYYLLRFAINVLSRIVSGLLYSFRIFRLMLAECM